MKDRARNIVFFLIHFSAVLILYVGITLIGHHKSKDIITYIKQADSLNVVIHNLNEDICVINQVNSQNEILLQKIFKDNPGLEVKYDTSSIGEK